MAPSFREELGECTPPRCSALMRPHPWRGPSSGCSASSAAISPAACCSSSTCSWWSRRTSWARWRATRSSSAGSTPPACPSWTSRSSLVARRGRRLRPRGPAAGARTPAHRQPGPLRGDRPRARRAPAAGPPPPWLFPRRLRVGRGLRRARAGAGVDARELRARPARGAAAVRLRGRRRDARRDGRGLPLDLGRRLYGAESLLVLVSACLLARTLLVGALWRGRPRGREAAAHARAAARLRGSLRLVLGSPHLRAIAGIVLLSSFVTAVSGWQIKAIAQQALVGQGRPRRILRRLQRLGGRALRGDPGAPHRGHPASFRPRPGPLAAPGRASSPARAGSSS